MPDILSIQEALTKVMQDVGAVAKNQRNDQQKFSFRGVDAVVNAVSPALQAHNVVVSPRLDHIEYVEVKTTKGSVMTSARVIVTYRFYGQGGDFIEATVPGEAFDSGDKATAKAMSVAFRTALLQALTLPTDEIDPDAQTYERSGESTAANEGMPVTGSPSEPRGAQAAQSPLTDSGPLQGQAAASPATSTGVAGNPVEPEAPAGDAGVATPAGASSNYLSREDQALLTTQFGSKIAAINAYKNRFGSHITRLADITYEMRDEIESAAVPGAGGYG